MRHKMLKAEASARLSHNPTTGDEKFFPIQLLLNYFASKTM